jgi:hypothetical protein
MAKKRTTAQRRAAAKAAWALRRLKSATAPTPAGEFASGNELLSPGYETLAFELASAFQQSATGKGKQRHATTGKPFDRQPIMEIGRMVGPGYPAGQAQKKAQEALGMVRRGENDKAIAELHGAIVYLAATAALIREG